jgi:hypothetical protein
MGLSCGRDDGVTQQGSLDDDDNSISIHRFGKDIRRVEGTKLRTCKMAQITFGLAANNPDILE